jgi:hypothetical protein
MMRALEILFTALNVALAALVLLRVTRTFRRPRSDEGTAVKLKRFDSGEDCQ